MEIYGDAKNSFVSSYQVTCLPFRRINFINFRLLLLVKQRSSKQILTRFSLFRF